MTKYHNNDEIDAVAKFDAGGGAETTVALLAVLYGRSCLCQVLSI